MFSFTPQSNLTGAETTMVCTSEVTPAVTEQETNLGLSLPTPQ